MIVDDTIIKDLGKRYFHGSMPGEIQRYFRQMILLDECLTETLCNFKSCQHDIDENKYLQDFISWRHLEEEYQYFRKNAFLSRTEPLPAPTRYILKKGPKAGVPSGSLEEVGVQGQSPT